MSAQPSIVPRLCTAPLLEQRVVHDCGHPAVVAFLLGKEFPPMRRCAQHAPKTRETLRAYVKSFAEEDIE